MAYPIEIKEKVIVLRQRGNSLNEIHRAMGISKSVLSGWLYNINLSHQAKDILLSKIKRGQFVSAENKKQKTRETLQYYFDSANKELDSVKIDIVQARILCSLMYWCEGTKDHFTGVNFVNSDPRLIQIFLNFFRSGFDVDEKKFRPCIHLHAYHNPTKQLAFWSKVTKIPKSQFIKPYLKKNNGKRVREGYQGCISIKYHSNDMARQLLMMGKAFIEKFGGMV